MDYKGTLHIAPALVAGDGSLYAGTYIKVPTPQTYGWSLEDLDSEEGTGRNNATGEMFRDRVATKRKLSFTWPPLSIEDTSTLLKAINPDGTGQVFIFVRYLDAREGAYLEKPFYAGPQSANCGHRARWLGITANLIEK